MRSTPQAHGRHSPVELTATPRNKFFLLKRAGEILTEGLVPIQSFVPRGDAGKSNFTVHVDPNRRINFFATLPHIPGRVPVSCLGFLMPNFRHDILRPPHQFQRTIHKVGGAGWRTSQVAAALSQGRASDSYARRWTAVANLGLFHGIEEDV